MVSRIKSTVIPIDAKEPRAEIIGEVAANPIDATLRVWLDRATRRLQGSRSLGGEEAHIDKRRDATGLTRHDEKKKGPNGTRFQSPPRGGGMAKMIHDERESPARARLAPRLPARCRPSCNAG